MEKLESVGQVEKKHVHVTTSRVQAQTKLVITIEVLSS